MPVCVLPASSDEAAEEGAPGLSTFLSSFQIRLNKKKRRCHVGTGRQKWREFGAMLLELLPWLSFELSILYRFLFDGSWMATTTSNSYALTGMMDRLLLWACGIRDWHKQIKICSSWFTIDIVLVSSAGFISHQRYPPNKGIRYGLLMIENLVRENLQRLETR
jgi:hypothetical protein